jgi:hypothetical protein
MLFQVGQIKAQMKGKKSDFARRDVTGKSIRH